MRFGVTLPNLGVDDGPQQLVELAVAAEDAGWDGVFFWDTFGSTEYDRRFAGDHWRRAPWDVWSLLSAVAARTRRVRLGTLITPISRRRPWKLAAEAATVDQLSGGRLILSVGLGWVPDAALSRAPEEVSRRARAQRLDEGLAIASALWSEPQVTFQGRHYSIDSFPGLPSVQQPRIPIWVVGAWPQQRSMSRALRFDGLLPVVRRRLEDHISWMQPSASELATIVEDIEPEAPAGFDVIAEGYTSRDPTRAAEKVAPYGEAGATWWLEGVWGLLHGDEPAPARMLQRIQIGPPALPADP